MPSKKILLSFQKILSFLIIISRWTSFQLMTIICSVSISTTTSRYLRTFPFLNTFFYISQLKIRTRRRFLIVFCRREFTSFFFAYKAAVCHHSVKSSLRRSVHLIVTLEQATNVNFLSLPNDIKLASTHTLLKERHKFHFP